ncbi:DUF4124 domain-containing protein [bacterium]|nr:MAG: DUF4124 domain-containing protein [bacterium]
MKKHAVILICSIMLTASASYAEIYQWTDKNGVVHMTNEVSRVPEEYRDQLKTFKPSKKNNQNEPAVQSEPTQNAGPELYGDEPLEWWKENFRKKREDAQAVEQSIAAKKEFMKMFEGGRRGGQIYDAKDVDRYEAYKKELPADESRVNTLKDEINELTRRAKINGVPKTVYGE